MNSVIKGTLIFLGGLAIGGIATNMLVKDKYAKEASDEISAMHKSFINRYKEPISEVKEVKNEEPERNDNESYISNEASVIDYSSFSKREEKPVESEPEVEEAEEDVVEMKREVSENPIYEIPWETYESSEEDGYSHVECVLYTEDYILANVYDEKIDDVEKRVTVDILNRFAHVPKDEIWVRNEVLGCDFNIIKDNRKFSDVVGEGLPSEEEVDVL